MAISREAIIEIVEWRMAHYDKPKLKEWIISLEETIAMYAQLTQDYTKLVKDLQEEIKRHSAETQDQDLRV